MNTISLSELKNYYLKNPDATALAEHVFGKDQPRIYRTGFYSAPSWNWAYKIGLVQVGGQVYEVVTQFGSVVAAVEVQIPEHKE